jgi:hypothetical protein
LIARSFTPEQAGQMATLPHLPNSAVEYRTDAERCRRLSKGVSDRDVALMLSLARANDLRASEVEAIERLIDKGGGGCI